ncbi:hypothetical protein V8E36_004424 [Tilletia maclaganii]
MHHGLALRGSQLNTAAHRANPGNILHARQAKKHFSLTNPPDTWEEGQIGTNQCVQKYGNSSDKSLCQTVRINSFSDFCLYGPPNGPAEVGNTETEVVAYCIKDGYGTRLIPSGTFKSIVFLKTQNYVEVLGTGDLTPLGIEAGDQGGELDPHGADGTGNPKGGLVYTNAFTGQDQQIDEWMMFIGATEFCFRACKPEDPLAWQRCNHIYDTEGCTWNMPSAQGYDPNNPVFESCEADDPYFPGVYGAYTFHHGDPKTPDAHPPPVLKNCKAESPPAGASPAPSTGVTSGDGTGAAESPTNATGPATGGGAAPASPAPTAAPGTKPKGGALPAVPGGGSGTPRPGSSAQSGAVRRRRGREDSSVLELVVGYAMVVATVVAAAAAMLIL